MSGLSRRSNKRPGNSYWDSCIFLAILTGEVRLQEETDELDRQQTLFDEGRLHLYTSTLTTVEVLDSLLPADAANQLRLVFQRRNFHLEQVTQRVCLKAHAIRDYYATAHDGFGTFSTPDAIHLATAIETGCDYFFTFDGSGGKEKHKGFRTILPAVQSLKTQFGLTVVRPCLLPDPNKNLALEFDTIAADDEEM